MFSKITAILALSLIATASAAPKGTLISAPKVVKKLLAKVAPKKVKTVKKVIKHIRMISAPRFVPTVHIAKKLPSARGQFGTKTFLDSRAAFKQAQDARAVFRSRQKVLAAKRNSESEIYFKSLAVYIKAKAVAVKAKEDLKVAKDAHDVAKTEVKRLEGIKTTQTKTRNTTRDAHDLAKKTHRLSLAELAKLKATRVTADAAVDETKKKLV